MNGDATRHSSAKGLVMMQAGGEARASWRRRVILVLWGLRQPHATGAYRHARLQLTRQLAWVAAILIPALVALLLVMATVGSPPKTADEAIVVDARQEEELPPLDEQPMLDPVVAESMAESAMTTEGWSAEVTEPDVVVREVAMETRPHDVILPAVGERWLPAVAIPAMAGLPTQRGQGREQALLEGHADRGNEEAVLRALRWLKSVQRPDGAWEDPPAAMTGLALLTYLAHGDTPASEEFGSTLQRGLEWLLEAQQADGRFRGGDEHEYSHPIAAYALSEAFMMTRVPRIRDAAERAVAVILDGQHAAGGWDYNCQESARNDTSYSGWCVQALKAGLVAGLRNAALAEGLRRSGAAFRRNAAPDGGFGYTEPGRTSLTGVGVLSLHLLGENQARAARLGLSYMDQSVTFNWEKPTEMRPLYGWYYATQAYFHAGQVSWTRWHRAYEGELIRRQVVVAGAAAGGRDVGYWDSPHERERYGRVYSTTLCTLMLEVFYRHLATFKPVEVNSPSPEWPDDDAEIDIVVTGVTDRSV